MKLKMSVNFPRCARQAIIPKVLLYTINEFIRCNKKNLKWPLYLGKIFWFCHIRIQVYGLKFQTKCLITLILSPVKTVHLIDYKFSKYFEN